MHILLRRRSSVARQGIDRLIELVLQAARERVEVRPTSPTEVGLLLHGLEFARVRHGVAAHSFAREDEVTFGAGANETPLTEENEAAVPGAVARGCFRVGTRMARTPIRLFRMQPEHWLESRLRAGIAELLPGLRGDLMYSQVPAISSGDRGMLDLLTLDRNGRLAVIELKADEDLHLPMQALDYWIRVRALNDDRQAVAGGRAAYCVRTARVTLPVRRFHRWSRRLLLVAPALRIHPANEPVLRYFSPQVEWELIAVSEHWRRELKKVFCKRSGDSREISGLGAGFESLKAGVRRREELGHRCIHAGFQRGSGGSVSAHSCRRA